MRELFIVYDLTVHGKMYLVILNDGTTKWNVYPEQATPMEKPTAASWIAIQQLSWPLSTFGMETV